MPVAPPHSLEDKDRDSGGIITTSGSFATWRGRRDPQATSSTHDTYRKSYNTPNETKDPNKKHVRRDEFTGYGGMQRRR